jgi:3-methyladenine DNA glycosylase/8-oxoguanine DNA glycosylase
VRAWGLGARWALEFAPDVLGLHDGIEGFDPPPGPVRELHRRFPGVRITRTRGVFEAMVPSIVEQRIAGAEARRSYRSMVMAWGEPAPGPGGLRLPPAPSILAGKAYFDYHPMGIERRRATTIREAARLAPRLDALAEESPEEAARRMGAIPGVGPWTAAEVAVVALGDADAVPVGDYHLPHTVAWLLAGEARGSDARMLELLAPYRGHRGRVLRLIGASGITAPRFGPRQSIRSIRRI